MDRIAFGPRAGQKELTVQGTMPREPGFKQNLCADISGFSLHAAVRRGAEDRQAREQLCLCITRPALANERVQCNAAGQVVLKLKTQFQSLVGAESSPSLRNFVRTHALDQMRAIAAFSTGLENAATVPDLGGTEGETAFQVDAVYACRDCFGVVCGCL